MGGCRRVYGVSGEVSWGRDEPKPDIYPVSGTIVCCCFYFHFQTHPFTNEVFLFDLSYHMATYSTGIEYQLTLKIEMVKTLITSGIAKKHLEQKDYMDR